LGGSAVAAPASPAGATTAVLHVPADYGTIQAAITAAAPGDTVLVAPGTYAEHVDFTGKDVHLVSTGGAESTTIDGTSTGTTVTIGPLASIQGFTITGGRADFGAGMTTIGNGSVVTENVFADNQQLGGGFGAAIAINHASPTISRNLFVNNSCDDQFLSGVVSVVNASLPLIVNNIVRDNPCRAFNLSVPVEGAPSLINNTIVRNRVGVRVDGRVVSVTSTVRNNLITNNGVGLEDDFGHAPTWDHNLVWSNTTDYDGIADQTGTAGNLSANPLFADSAAGVFQLAPGSPALGTGSQLSAPTDDFDGLTRGSSIDIGALARSTIARHTSFNCTIRSQANQKFVTTELSALGILNDSLRALATVASSWERLRCVALDGNTWAFRSRAIGKYVAAELFDPSPINAVLRARSKAVGAWETFTIPTVNACKNCVAVRSAANHLYVSAELHYAGAVNGLLRARAPQPKSYETFVIAGDAH
jgi:hypothetical protein